MRLSQHEMWEEYLDLCADGAFGDDISAEQLTRKLRYEGVANAALKHTEAADRIIAKLVEQRKALPAPATQPADRNRRRSLATVSAKTKEKAERRCSNAASGSQDADSKHELDGLVSGDEARPSTQPAAVRSARL